MLCIVIIMDIFKAPLTGGYSEALSALLYLKLKLYLKLSARE